MTPSEKQPISLSSSTPAPVPAVADCWNQIGVYGDSTCSKLKEHSHCRNCPDYSAAGVLLLDRALPPGYRSEWAAHFAKEKPPRELGNVSAVVFRLHDEWLALPSQAFHEVAEWRPIHSLPHRRHGMVLGLVSLRGELLIAVSLGHLLGLQKLPSATQLRTAYPRLLVATCDGQRFAFPVDDVQGPHRFHSQDIKSVPATVANAQRSYAQGVLSWENRSVGLLDTDLLFAGLNQSLS